MNNKLELNNEENKEFTLGTMFAMLEKSILKTQSKRSQDVRSMTSLNFCIVRMYCRYGEYRKQLWLGQYIHQHTAHNYQPPQMVIAIYGKWNKGAKQYHNIIIELSGGEKILASDIKLIAKDENDYFDPENKKS